MPKFIPFKFAILFQSFAIFKSTHALSHLPVVCASPLHSHHSLQLLFHSHFNFPLPFLLLPLHLFTPMPPSYQHTLQPFSFSLDVFHSLPPNHTNQIAASITQIVVPFATNIITSTFTSTCHSFSNFDSTSARLHSTIFIDFCPTIPYFNFNYLMLLVM